jgi:hypothetical protein
VRGKAGNALGAAAPARDRIAHGLHGSSHEAADLAQTQNAHAAVGAGAHGAAQPVAGLLLAREQIQLARVAQRGADHILGDLHMLLRIDGARHGQASRQVGHGQQLVHARTGRAQQLELRIGRQHAGLEAPGEHGFDLGGRCLFAMGPDLHVGRQRTQRIDDGRAHAGVDVDQNSH